MAAGRSFSIPLRAASPSSPQVDGDPTLYNMPTEIRCGIFEYLLPDSQKIIYPTCDDTGRTQESSAKSSMPASANDITTSRSSCQRVHSDASSPTLIYIHQNNTTTLMSVCKRFRSDVHALVCGSRCFEIHIHEGLTSAGVEIIDAGRQKLHHHAGSTDVRFPHFRMDDMYCIGMVRKLSVVIIPTTESITPCAARNLALVTYFNSLTICQQLKQGLEKAGNAKMGLLEITIRANPICEKVHSTHVASSQPAQAASGNPHPWYNEASQKPRGSILHGVTAVELALRPFAAVRAHVVRVNLPPQLQDHEDTSKFVKRLQKVILGKEKEPSLGGECIRDRAEIFRDTMEDLG